MPRPFTRAQALQNQAFLNLLERTGNARAAARELGVHRATFTRRRAKHPAFAAEWDAALAVAHATLRRDKAGRGAARRAGEGDGAHRIRLANGRYQLRRAGPRRLTREAEQAFLAALGASANVRLSAAAAGFSHSAFYHRAKTSPAFAREMRLALQQGYDRLEMALLESWLPAGHRDDGWRHNDPPALPPMTVDQALHLLFLHQKEARLRAEPAHIRRRRGESREAHSVRLAAMHAEAMRRDREAFEVAEAARRSRGEPSPFDVPVRPVDLAQVTRGRRRG